jgi:hypothetical protein
MDMKKYSGEHFIKVADVRDCPLQMQIAVVREGKFEKPDLVFESGDVFSLNSTNNQTLIRSYGRNSDAWIGKTVELFLGEIEFQKEMREAVKVRPISPPIEKPPEKLASKPPYDDQIPF